MMDTDALVSASHSPQTGRQPNTAAAALASISKTPAERPVYVQRRHGFSLIELVVVIVILGVLAMIVLPRYIAMGREARVAAVNTMASALASQAENLHVLCKLSPDCDYGNLAQMVTIAGRPAFLSYGYPDVGVGGATGLLDAWINYSGFSLVIPSGGGNPNTATFTLDGSPDPATCSVRYDDAFYNANLHGLAPIYTITITKSGC